jgi:uncharacterized membrane protein
MRLAGFLLCLAALAAAPVRAEMLPQLYDVAGVTAGDVLNIRAAPQASAAIIGTLAPDAQGVEVVAQNASGTWGQINTGETAGWVNLRYLEARGVHIDNYNLPVGLSCYGTEPFWSLSNINGALQYEAMDGPAKALDIWIAQDSGIAGDLRRMILMAGLGGPATAFLYPAACTDGMSDRAFGLAISLMTAPDAPMLSGCCSLTAQRR